MAEQHVVVVGGGVAGLATTMKLAEAGLRIYLISAVPVRRSPSVCAQDGINAVNALGKQRGDSEWSHFEDTVCTGAFLQHQPPVKEMCAWGPRIVDLLDRLGVSFDRTAEGLVDRRCLGGEHFARVVCAGAGTGQHTLYALDEQVRRWEVEGLVEKFERWEFLGLILDAQGHCRGVVGQDLVSMEIRPFAADAVILATGGCGAIFAHHATSTVSTGSAAARAYRDGVHYANGEFIQFHPTTVPSADKARVVSKCVRSEGGRIWVPRNPQDDRHPASIPPTDRYYFLEERYPAYGNLVADDVATRELVDVCVKGGLSADRDRPCVYLDVTDLPLETLDKLDGFLEVYQKSTGIDPHVEPMKVYPSVHASLGGLWADFEQRSETGGLVVGSTRNHHSNVPGVFVVGEADYQYHGASRLSGNGLLSSLFSGLIVAPSVVNWVQALPFGSAEDQPVSLFDNAVTPHAKRLRELVGNEGGENPYELHRELADSMTKSLMAVRRDKDIGVTLEKIDELKERYERVTLSDRSDWLNQNLIFVRTLGDMLTLAKVIAKGALLRGECRGTHFKPECEVPLPDADDPATMRHRAEAWCRAFEANNEKWLRTTVARHTPDGPEIEYEAVNTRLLPPRPGTLGRKGSEIIERVWRELHPSEQSTQG